MPAHRGMQVRLPGGRLILRGRRYQHRKLPRREPGRPRLRRWAPRSPVLRSHMLRSLMVHRLAPRAAASRNCALPWSSEPRNSKLHNPELWSPVLPSPDVLRTPELRSLQLLRRVRQLELRRRELWSAGPHRERRYRRRPPSKTLRNRRAYRLHRFPSVQTSGASRARPLPRQLRGAGRCWNPDPARRLRRPQRARRLRGPQPPVRPRPHPRPRVRFMRHHCEPGPTTPRRNCSTRLSSRHTISLRPQRLWPTKIPLAWRLRSRGFGRRLRRGGDAGSRRRGPAPSELAVGLISCRDCCAERC